MIGTVESWEAKRWDGMQWVHDRMHGGYVTLRISDPEDFERLTGHGLGLEVILDVADPH